MFDTQYELIGYCSNENEAVRRLGERGREIWNILHETEEERKAKKELDFKLFLSRYTMSQEEAEDILCDAEEIELPEDEP